MTPSTQEKIPSTSPPSREITADPIEIVACTARFDGLVTLSTRLPPRYLGFRAASGLVVFNSVLVEVDDESGKSVGVTRIDEMVEI